MRGSRRRAALVLATAIALVLAACGRRTPTIQQQSFDTPEDAVAALVTAVEANDIGALQRLLGPGVQRLLGPGIEGVLSSGDAVADRNARASFLRKFRAQNRLVAGGPDDLALHVGEDDWPLPIPLVRRDGRWRFDGAAGAQELLLRRIGSNELHTIDVMRGFVAAQEEYAASGHDGAGPGVYAQRLRSRPGKHDGLYWEVDDGERPSPAGPLLAAAVAEGYDGNELPRKAYHGYVFRMLFAQGPSANGGARDYIVDGKLIGGFALLATPALYGISGVMTFMVSQEGVVWQRDLGPHTARLAASIHAFDPDAQWTPIAPEGEH
jgi:hypothetical protein